MVGNKGAKGQLEAEQDSAQGELEVEQDRRTGRSVVEVTKGLNMAGQKCRPNGYFHVAKCSSFMVTLEIVAHG